MKNPSDTFVLNQIPRWWLVLPVLLLGMWLGARGLNYDNARDDELTTMSHIGGMQTSPATPLEIVDSLQTYSPQHTPLYFWMLNGWGRLAGFSLVPMRAVAMLFGVMGLAAVYRLGADVISPRVGLYASLVLVLNAFLIFYFHEVRMYTLFLTLATLAFWFYYQLTHRQKVGVWWWVATGLCTVLLLYTHTFGLLVMGAIGLFHLIFTAKNRRWLQITGMYLVSGIAYLPWLGVMLDGMFRATTKEGIQEASIEWHEFVRLLPEIFSNNTTWLLLLVLAIGLYTLYKRRQGAAWVFGMVVLLLALMIGLNEVLQLVKPNRMRYTLGAWPLIAMIVGLGLVELERWRWSKWLVGVFFVAWAFSGFNLLDKTRYDGNSKYVRNMLPFYELLPQIHTQAETNDYILVLSGNDLPLKERDKWKMAVGDFYMNNLDNEYAILFHKILPENAVENTLNAIHQHPRVWVISQPDRESPLLPEFEQALATDYNLCPPLLVDDRLQIDVYSQNGCETS